MTSILLLKMECSSGAKGLLMTTPVDTLVVKEAVKSLLGTVASYSTQTSPLNSKALFKPLL